MLKRLLIIAVVLGIAWLVRRVFRRAMTQATRPAGSVPPQDPGSQMVRDRVCNTFLPRSSALSSHLGGEEHFFCSERCRQSFLERS